MLYSSVEFTPCEGAALSRYHKKKDTFNFTRSLL